MNGLSIFAGIDSNGVVRFVGDVPRGAACGCRCDACGAALVAKRGEINTWHFAHEASQERPECFAGAVNLLRRLAIEVLKSAGRFALPMLRVRVTTRPPLPVLQEHIEWDPGVGTVEHWEAIPAREAPTGRLVLASGARVHLFVEVGNERHSKLGAVDPSVGSLLFSVPLPTDPEQLKDVETAKRFIVASGSFTWGRLPDVDSKVAEARQRLDQAARARARLPEEINALHRMGDRHRPSAAMAAEMPVAAKPTDTDESPWAAWRKPRSSFIFYGLGDGSAWLMLQHKDGRAVLVPWPRAEEGWDESLPARLGSADHELGGVVLTSDVNAMIYLRGRPDGGVVVRTSSSWSEISSITWPPRKSS